MVNQEIADIFDRMARVLAFKGANRFRVLAYRRGAASLRDLRSDLAQMPPDSYDDIPAIGEDLSAMIAEYVDKGKISAYDRECHDIPDRLIELMNIPGLGPKTLLTLHRSLGVSSIESLRRALDDPAILNLPGFGERKVQRLREAIDIWTAGQERISIGIAMPVAEDLLQHIRALPDVLKADIAGSLRRGKDTIGDLDLLVCASDAARTLESIARLPQVRKIIARGATLLTLRLEGGLQVDIRAVNEPAFGSALQYFTGSRDHNIRLRSLARSSGLKLNEYGVFRGQQQIGGRREEDVYQCLNLAPIAPELREDRGEIDAAINGALPQIVSQADIRGDLHVHSRYSDGRASIEELLDAATTLGYQYLAVSDHSPASRIARGLDAGRLLRKLSETDTLRGKRSSRLPMLLAGAEVDIRPDGQLDYPDEILNQLDVVIVAIHSAFRQSSDRMTGRLLDALDHPRVHILAHPTARLLGARAPIRFDVARVFERAASRRIALELNGSYLRVDLNDTMTRLAREAACLLSLASDAHSCDRLSDIRFGLLQARRAWISPAGIVNCWSQFELLEWLRSRRLPDGHAPT